MRQLKEALEELKKGNTEPLVGAAERLKALPRLSDGLFDVAQLGEDCFEAAKTVYPVYAAYETNCNREGGYPDLLAQVKRLDEVQREQADAAVTAKFLDALLETITYVTPQLYEYYRSLVDIFRSNAGEALCAMQEMPEEAAAAIRGTIARAGELGVMPEDARMSAWVAEQKTEESVAVQLTEVARTSRSAVIEIKDGGRYATRTPYRVCVNGREMLTAEKTIVSLHGLLPDTVYRVELFDGQTKAGELSLRTDEEFVTLDVRQFGAKGDGTQDDTPFLQAAILACPRKGRVLVPAGVYRVTSLFLKSHLRLELAEGAELRAFTEPEKFPVLPGMLTGFNGVGQYNLGSWEGNPLNAYAGIICGLDVEDVVIYGGGTINGNASRQDWWGRKYSEVFRPRLFFLNHCKNVTLSGVKVCNSPSWTLHPYFSENVRFIDLFIQNPADSPNTDGCDPESCTDVDILGVHFSVGDDCIAVKSGKIYMGKTYRQPSRNIRIRQCLMENGHGAVTLGSEMAGGILDLTVEDCIFSHTDRGLRIKTRRGRGRDAVIDNIVFRNLTLDHVMTPLVVNSFYFCDPDGRTPYVQSREPYPVDERTPLIKKMVFENMSCTNCHVAAAYFEGLPEQKIEELALRNISFTYAEQPTAGVPAMSEGVEKSTKRGFFARNVKKLTIEQVRIEGQEGADYELLDVDELVRK